MTKHSYYDLNKVGRDFVVGDIHGCFELLLRHLELLSFNGDVDRLFSVGDVVDRGPESLECLKLIHKPWFHMVRGNHEDMMINSVIGGHGKRLWELNGGTWSKDIDTDELHDLSKRVLEEIPISMTIKTREGNIGICHAQPPSDNWEHAQTPTSRDEHIMLWSRDIIKRKAAYEDFDFLVKGVHKVYCGHTPLRKATTVGNIEFIDTGAVFNTPGFAGELTIRRIR